MTQRPIAFVLGGGGVRGAVQVGMIRALLEADIVPDLIVGTSIGAINGALVAADPTPGVVPRLHRAWASPAAKAVYGDSVPKQLRRLVSTRTHLNSPEPLRKLLTEGLGEDVTFADLKVPLRVIAASIERAAEQAFSEGPLIDAVLASAAVPGILPPMRIGAEHYMDGGLVNSIPLEDAVQSGARTVYVLQVGRVEEPLSPPTDPVGTAKVAFEVARRHRFARDMTLVPSNTRVHVLPSGGALEGDEKLRSYRNMDTVTRRIERSYAASRQYLAALEVG